MFFCASRYVHGGGGGCEEGDGASWVAVAPCCVGAAHGGDLGSPRMVVVFSSTIEEWCGSEGH